jgi:hydroxyacylglutathione hydrolase
MICDPGEGILHEYASQLPHRATGTWSNGKLRVSDHRHRHPARGGGRSGVGYSNGTTSHHDHINGIDELQQHTDAQLHLLKPEAEFWGEKLDLPTLHHGGDVIQLGKTPITILFTPGHTPGSACYHLGSDLITGDTMFVYGCGRCDLRGGDPEEMFDTLNKLRTEMPRNTVIHPGHNYSVTPISTLDDEIAGNPFFHFEDRDKFIEYRMEVHDKVRSAPLHPVFSK